jgi:hypothetical protein
LPRITKSTLGAKPFAVAITQTVGKTMSKHYNPKVGKAAKFSLSVTIAALLVVVSYFASFFNQATQALFASIFTLGVLCIGSPSSALLISGVGGVAYSFVSPRFGFLMLVPWLVRGVVSASILKGTGAFNSPQPSAWKVTLSMTVASLLTGTSQYLWLVKILQVLPDTTATLIATETAIAIAVTSTAIVSYLTTKYLFKRVKPLLFW